jgi:predicted nucleotidyltransferase
VSLVEKLKRYFDKRQEVAFSFLFGSQARGSANKLSDVDIAVFFYPEKGGHLEYEREVFYATEDEIWADLERLVNREVELLVLNRSSASIAASAIRGIPVVVNDWGLYLDFMQIVTREAEDFREMLFKDFIERNSFEGRI